MKAVTETLSPTRIKLTIEVPFDELRPSLDVAYKKIAGQVRVQGFRPGKVPPRVLDQRVGRGAVLDEAIQDALPRFYSAAVEEHDVAVLGRPDVDVTSFGDGDPLVFTAEVDVRPTFELPDYDGLPVTVDVAEATDEDVTTQLNNLRDRFAVLEAVDRPVESGDFVSIDLEAARDGVAVPDATTTGLSYEVGSATLVDGLDDNLVGLVDGASATFTTDLLDGEDGAKPAEVSVTVRSVKKKVLPELDDEFATTASEFDTLEELSADMRGRIERVKRLEQGMQARDRVLEALLERVEVPLPEVAVTEEINARMHQMGHELERMGATLEAYLEAQGKTGEELDAEVRAGAEQSVKSSLVLDAIVTKEELQVNDAELTDQLVRRAQRIGVEPQAYADQLVRAGQVNSLVGEIVRGKALATVMEAAVVTDTAGTPVDLDALSDTLGVGTTASADVDEHAGHDHGDHEGHDHEGHDHEGHDHEGHDHD